MIPKGNFFFQVRKVVGFTVRGGVLEHIAAVDVATV